MSTNVNRLFLPALRAKMGDWIYYITLMNMKEVASRVSVADDIHSSASLKELLQRMLANNSKRFTEYLLSQEQRFFNAIVIGSFGGSPNWHDLSVRGRKGVADIPEHPEGSMGFLELSGDEALFAIDGQYRVKGIKEANARDRSLEKEEVCAIFVKGVPASERHKDPDGFERTRRLFSTLNRYAKPINKRDIIAFDKDDVVAVVTRRLLEEHPLLRNKVDTGLKNSIKPDDHTNLTTIATLYDTMDVVLRDRTKGWNDYKRWRPPEKEVDVLYAKAVQFWDGLSRQFPPLTELRESSAEEKVAGKYRGSHGGQLLFRPVGLFLVTRVAVDLRSSMSLSDNAALECVGRTPTELSEHPWSGLLWDSANKRMITEKENQNIARRLLFNALGGDLSRAPYKTTTDVLWKQYADALNGTPDEIELPRYPRRLGSC